MENQNVLDRDYFAEENLRVTDQVKDNLRITAKWARFLAIVGFVNIGLMLIGGIWMLGMTGSIPTEDVPYASGFEAMFRYMAYLYIILCIIVFFPNLYLYKFGTSTLKSLESAEQLDFDEGIENLKKLFRFIGILVAIFIGLYMLILLFWGLATLAS